MVTIDAHPPRKLLGAKDYDISSNVGRVLNIFQKKPAGPFNATNGFQGGEVGCIGCSSNPNIDLTRVPHLVHQNIVRYSLEYYSTEINSVLGVD